VTKNEQENPHFHAILGYKFYDIIVSKVKMIKKSEKVRA
jgi:hypothetical protein